MVTLKAQVLESLQIRFVAAKYNEEKFTPESDSENTKEEI